MALRAHIKGDPRHESPSRMLRCCLMLAALCFLCLAGRPAQAALWCGEPVCPGDIVTDPETLQANESGLAESIKLWAEKHFHMQTIPGLVEELKDMINVEVKNLGDNFVTVFNALTAAEKIVNKVRIDTTDAISDAEAKNTLLKAKLNNVVDHADMAPSEQFLCNLILVRQVVPVMTEFARIVSRVVTRGIDERYRCSTCDGNGPQYAGDLTRIKRGETVENGLKSGSILDGVAEENRSTETLPGLGPEGTDISADSLSRDMVYSMPPIKLVEKQVNGQSQMVKEFVPEKGNAAQQMWILARQYCYNVAGPRPTPPHGEAMDTADGKARRQRFDACVAQQDGFVKACGDRLAKLTRPDCANDDFKPFCDAAVQACDAAAEAHITLPPEYNDCGQGLSLYQAEYLSNILCGSTRSVQADGHNGATEPERVTSLVLCQLMSQAWERQIQEEDKSWMQAVQGMQESKDCYKGSGRN